MHIVFAYDIPDDKRRERLRKALLRFGSPVQKSVFELDLTRKQFDKMLKTVKSIIVPAQDNARYYFLCPVCAEKVETFGGRELTKSMLAYVV